MGMRLLGARRVDELTPEMVCVPPMLTFSVGLTRLSG